MRVEYEAKHDLMNIEFLKDVDIADSVETDGIMFDYSEDKRISRSPLDMVDFAVVKD